VTSALHAQYEEARTRWPGVQLTEDELAAHAARVVPADAADQPVSPELYLALACGRGNPAALAILERDYLSTLPAALARICGGAAAVDEVLQAVRTELCAPRPGAGPRILGYGGRGNLRAWLRSVAVRTAMRMNRATAPADALSDEHAAPEADTDVELAFMKKTYGAAFHRAFQRALAGLDEAQRLLLKQRFRHHMTVEQLGVLHAVNPGTISRRVAAAREELVKATRAAMMEELDVDKADVESILRLIYSQIELSLSTHGS
jgi:RNA polymerase sigma-70 factor (ECF subfamily)